MQSYDFKGWVYCNPDGFLIESSGHKHDYTELITDATQINIYLPQGLSYTEYYPEYCDYHKVYNNKTGFTKLRIINLMYETVMSAINEKYELEGLKHLAITGFNFNKATSSIYIQTSS